RKQSSCRSSPKRPNNSFKPNLLRYTNNVAGKACHVVGYATQVGLTQALGPVLSKLASFVDHRLVRGALTAVLIVACVLLGPLSVLAAAFGPREPILMALGLCGLAGLLRACARLGLGPRLVRTSRRPTALVR